MKLQLDKDTGEVRVPLIGASPNGTAPHPNGEADPNASGQWLTLPEPNLDQLAQLQEWAFEANERVPPIPITPQDATPAQVADVMAKAVERQRILRGDEGVYADVFIRLVAMLTGQTVERKQLPAWVCVPRTLELMIDHWTAPLGGEDARLQAASDIVVKMLEQLGVV